MRPRMYTVRLFDHRAHVLKTGDRTYCGLYAPPWWPRYAVRPDWGAVCRKCGAGP